MRTSITLFAVTMLAVSGAAVAQAVGSPRTPGASPIAAENSRFLESLSSQVRLIDASRKNVGIYYPDTRSVALAIGGALILARVTNQFDINAPFASLGEQSGSTYRWAVTGQTWFLTPDCSGPPIPLADSGLRPVAYLQDRTTGILTAYIGGVGRSAQKPANSYRQAALGGGPFRGACVPGAPFGGTIQGFEIEQIVNITQLYPEPLTVR